MNYIYPVMISILWIAILILYIKGDMGRFKYPHYKFSITMIIIATLGMLLFLWYCFLK